MSEYRLNRGSNHCSVEGCDKPFRCSGYCATHYQRFREWGSPLGSEFATAPKRVCEDCRKPVTSASLRCPKCAGKKRRIEAARRITESGYVTLLGHRDHPNAHARGHIYEHTLTMSNMLGRALLPGENVHHKNGVRDDNRPENLELWVVNQPAGQRPEDLVVWAQEILDRYGPDRAQRCA